MHNEVNVIVTGALVLVVLGALRVWLEPRVAMRVSRRLRARALALDAARGIYREVTRALLEKGKTA